MLTGKVITKILEDKAKEVTTYGVKKIGIFGSFAKSSQSNKSDIDILVEFQKGKKMFDNYILTGTHPT